ncbi:MAG: acylphosphatase [Gammaproteobacteria bacterium]
MKGIHCHISGKVQGVWFRANTQEQAVALGVTGYARNLADGRVEVKAFGEEEALAQFYRWLRQGPPLARVTDITKEDIDFEKLDSFFIQ